jgi:predicted Zn-dependent peptidase
VAPKTGLSLPSGATDIDARDIILRIVYPAPDALDVDVERRLEVFGDIVGDRLRADIREKLGSTYGPRGRAWGDPCFRGRGWVELHLEVEPAKLAETREACLASMERLAKSGVQKDEFQRLRAARAGNPEALAREPSFWLDQLHRAQRNPAIFEQLRDLKSWYDKVTLEQVNALARQLLTRDRASILEIKPR